jgi:hypothetical protein
MNVGCGDGDWRYGIRGSALGGLGDRGGDVISWAGRYVSYRYSDRLIEAHRRQMCAGADARGRKCPLIGLCLGLRN